MPFDYLPILILVIVAAGISALAIIVPSFLGPRKPDEVKLSTYESGKEPIGPARRRFHIQYYLTAMLFILFDIEVIFLYPWAVIFKKLKLFGLVEMAIFIAILLIGYIYVWRKGALEWD
ncbi:MAG: NADH-quinone oxidoreductase subunit A [Anaerolineae bacterium]